jgi:hypothetical protein
MDRAGCQDMVDIFVVLVLSVLSVFICVIRVKFLCRWERLAWLGELPVFGADGLGCGGEWVCGCDSRGAGGWAEID